MGIIVGAAPDPSPETWNERFKYATDPLTETNLAGYGP